MARDFLIEVQKGHVHKHSMVHKFGRNGSVPDGVWEFVNLLSFTAWPLSAATTVRIKAGGHANDDAGGLGAREITVQGIDDSFNEVSETIITAGVNASAVTTTLFWRVHRAWVSAIGTYGAANAANITIENGTGGTDLIEIGAGKGQTQFAGWTVPIGKKAYLLSLHIQVDNNLAANVRVYTRDNIDDTAAPMSSKRLRTFFAVKDGMPPYKPRGPELTINEKSDFWVEASGDGSAIAITCNFELLVVEEV